ncbi:protein kinase domain-containing protein [Neorhodopirellula pilleata]|uniref:Serine/threonine-protein kinase PknH n=1 Tax=Neorhodopirellula pilleata TaxID=2714738 RepID=A0A5C6AAA4_9BACT|nr:protein kinase [Neorhodopirellula pilleata]TWT96330.1 Serine/threonine-protein kinase PknH [Neorhodopirellula pilleata]
MNDPKRGDGDPIVDRIDESLEVTSDDAISHEMGSKLFTEGSGVSPLTKTIQVSSDQRKNRRSIGQTVGNYEVLEFLGQGGMGTVFRARHLKLGKEVALKLIRQRALTSEVALARFDRELRAVGRLDHPNIVRALDAGEFQDVTFLSMELLRGVDLDEVTGESGTLDLADACEVIRQTAIGLKYVHDQGLIHRDIKPSNLMLCRDSVNRVCVKIMDLGLALIQAEPEDDRLTGEGMAIGTFRYMSVEQARNTRSVDHRADIYSLGATLYRLLCGTPPYSKEQFETHTQLLMALMSGVVPDFKDKAPDLPAELTSLIARMLASEPGQRPQDLSEVIEILAPFSQSHQLDTLLDHSLRQRSVDTGQRSREEASAFDLIEKLVGPRMDDADQSEISFDAESSNIEILHQRVRRIWIDGVLGRTKDHTHLFSINREVVSECVDSPWDGIAENPLRGVDTQDSIDRLFKHAERSLLILGDAGAGKSTTMLELTESLLTQSARSRFSTVPVLLHLSSWSPRIGSLEQWIINELIAKYQIPKRIGQEFIDENRLILLLDGLDEVRPADQRACIESINQFMAQSTPSGLVVCSRYSDYVAIGHRLRLHDAIRLQPLTAEQIAASISGSTGERGALMTALAKHPSLLELASSPLMLNMMKVSFDNTSKESMESFGTIESAREHLFNTYIDEAFRGEKSSTARFTKDETLSWLSWIAKQMQTRNMTMFQVGEIQADWLPTISQRLSYLLALGLSLGTVSGVVTMYFWYRLMPIMDTAESTPLHSLLWLMLQLPVWWTQVCFLDLFVFSSRLPQGWWKRSFSGLAKTLVYWALWMLWPIVGGVTGVWTTGWTVANVLLGVLTGASVGILGRRKRVTVDVDVAQSLGISASGTFQGWAVGYAVGFCVYATYAVLYSLYLLEEPPAWFPYFWQNEEEWCVSVTWPLAFSSVGLVAGGLVPRLSREKTSADQSVRIYFRNLLIAGCFSMLAVFVVGMFDLQYWLSLPENTLEFSLWERAMLMSGGCVYASFYMALCFGGLDLLVHSLSRIVLSIDGMLPRNLSEFMKHSTRLGLLRRAGGAHIFGHRLLQEYFAEKENDVNSFHGS